MEPINLAMVFAAVILPLMVSMVVLSYVDRRWAYYVAAITVISSIVFATYSASLAYSVQPNDPELGIEYQRIFAGSLSALFVTLGLMFILYYLELGGGGRGGG